MNSIKIHVAFSRERAMQEITMCVQGCGICQATAPCAEEEDFFLPKKKYIFTPSRKKQIVKDRGHQSITSLFSPLFLFFAFCFNSLHTQRTPQKENRPPSKMDREVTLQSGFYAIEFRAHVSDMLFSSKIQIALKSTLV